MRGPQVAHRPSAAMSPPGSGVRKPTPGGACPPERESRSIARIAHEALASVGACRILCPLRRKQTRIRATLAGRAGNARRPLPAAVGAAGHVLPHAPDAMNLDLKARVLVAEDNPNLRKVIVNIVRKIGFSDIVEAEDGLAAWAKIEEGGVGLVLTDWSMPGMTGLDLLKKIRASQPPVSKLPFLMITAADTKDSILTAGKEGVDAYIIKPFSVKTIVDKIEEAVANRAGK